MTDYSPEQHWTDYQNGDDQAFRHIVEKYNKRLFFFIRGKVGDTENTKEILSKLWLRLVRKKSEDIKNLNAYIFQIAKRLIKDEYRTISRRPDLENIEDYEIKLKAETISKYDDEDLQERLKNILTQEEYEICELMVEGFNYRDIAQKYDRSSSTVANKLTSIRKKLEHIKLQQSL